MRLFQVQHAVMEHEGASGDGEAQTRAAGSEVADYDLHRHRLILACQVGFDASWEIDVFGGIRSQIDVAGATVQARIRGNITVQSEREQQAVISYQARVLGALQEVEDALSALTHEQVRRDRLTNATDAAQQAADLSLQLYSAGLRDFRDVLDSQRSLLTLQDSLASTTSSLSTDLVRLYKALGGGWTND